MPVWLVVISTTLCVVVNVGFWLFTMSYRFSSAPDHSAVHVVAFCQNTGFVLLLINALCIAYAMIKAVLVKNWWWVVLTIVLFIGLAYEAFLIWTMYIFALLQAKADGSFM